MLTYKAVPQRQKQYGTSEKMRKSDYHNKYDKKYLPNNNNLMILNDID